MTKILLLTDSLALARNFPEKTSFDETWPQLLRNDGYEIHQVSIGGATSTDLLKQLSYHKSFNPDIVLVQVGIVDCAPRFATKFEIEFLNHLPIVGKKILKRINTPSFRNYRKKTYVDPKTFLSNLKNIANSFECKVVFINILPVNIDYEKALPGITKNVKLYNSLISEMNFISLENIPYQGIMSDFHHLNQDGHTYLYSQVRNFINNKLYLQKIHKEHK